jgi:hypothetical protein
MLLAAGVWYLLCGLMCLWHASATHALDPWSMGMPFGIGQLLVAVTIRRPRDLEGPDAQR